MRIKKTKDKDRYYSVRNGLYFVKVTGDLIFYILNDSYEWERSPELSREYYDVLSGYVEITEEAMNNYILENKGLSR